MRAGDLGWTIAPVDRETYSAVFTLRHRLLDTGCLRVQQETNAFGFQGLLQLGGHVCVLAGKNLTAALDDGDLAAKAPEHLAKLQADVTPAQHEQVFRQFAQLHDAGVGQVIDRLEARQTGDVRVRSGVDEDSLALKLFIPDSKLVRTNKPRLAPI